MFSYSSNYPYNNNNIAFEQQVSSFTEKWFLNNNYEQEQES